MSGPKTSRYTLTPEQRRILAEQRAIERRKSVASETIKRNNKKLLQIGGMFSSAKQISNELLTRNGNDGGFAEKLRELEGLISPIAPLISSVNNDDVVSLENTARKITESLVLAEKLSFALCDISAKNEVDLQATLRADIDKGFETSFADIEKSPQKNSDEYKEKIRLQLTQMKTDIRLPKHLIADVEKALNNVNKIENEAFLKNFASVTVAPLIRNCKEFISEYESCYEEFENLNSEYVALCELYYYVAQEYSCCKASVEKLKQEIKRINDESAEEDEQAYISECLDEVMEEMGYTVIGSREVTKKNGKHFRNELYTYGEGTAVNVTYSSDGRIAMELGGIDSTDRLPDDAEISALCDSMERFCADFKEIEKRLLAKGVVLADRISLLPPSAEYAQIINTTDYNMEEKVEKLQTKKQRRTVTKQKTLRKE